VGKQDRSKGKGKGWGGRGERRRGVGERKGWRKRMMGCIKGCLGRKRISEEESGKKNEWSGEGRG